MIDETEWTMEQEIAYSQRLYNTIQDLAYALEKLEPELRTVRAKRILASAYKKAQKVL
jgi:hypothetical protein